MPVDSQSRRQSDLTQDELDVYALGGKKNPARPLYLRPKGEIGICMDVYDAEPLNEHEFGLRQCFIQTLMDKLLERLQEMPIEEVHSWFEREEMLQGARAKSVHRGVILSLSVADEDTLDKIWDMYESGELNEFVTGHLIPDEVVAQFNTKYIDLRTRLWKDEFEECRQEVSTGNLDFDDVLEKKHRDTMVSRVKTYQQTVPDKLITHQEKRAEFDNRLSEFMMCIKQGFPDNVQPVTSNEQMDELVASSGEDFDGSKKAAVDAYKEVNRYCRGLVAEMQQHIICPLLLIHTTLETKSQRELKARMREMHHLALRSGKPGFDLSILKSNEWGAKITGKENEIFSGVLGQVSMLGNTVIDVDQILDEYMSGFVRQ